VGDTQPNTAIRSRFRRALNAALNLYEKPRVAVVATTPDRADWIRQIVAQALEGEEQLSMYVADEASDAMQKREFEVVVLDSSLPDALREGLKEIAKQRLATCSVIVVVKWRAEPPG
jgi:DNA-binding NtrC family response regulator